MIDLKQGDTRHAINAVLKNVNGNPINLTNAEVEFHMKERYGNSLISKSAKQTENVGEIWVVFDEGDTEVVGFYNAEFQVTYSDGKKEIFPNKGTIDIKIEGRVKK